MSYVTQRMHDIRRRWHRHIRDASACTKIVYFDTLARHGLVEFPRLVDIPRVCLLMYGYVDAGQWTLPVFTSEEWDKGGITCCLF